MNRQRSPILPGAARAALVLLLGSAALTAQVIDFETIPGGAPVDGLPVSGQFAATHGVTFSLQGGGTPVLAEVGAPRTAFQGYQQLDDQPAPGTNVGQFFLTDDGTLAGLPDPLVITYAVPVSAASGVVLDIDGTEEWTVEALDVAGAVVASTVLGPNNSLDGSATNWSFSPGSPLIGAIRISFTGVAPSGLVGLAFDNFDATAVQPGIGQANGPDARLEVNGVGSGTANGPFSVQVAAPGTLVLDWHGPPDQPLMLLAGPLNPASVSLPCVGTVDIGTPPLYMDLVTVLDGTTAPGSLFFRTDPTGHASQTFTLPSSPPGVLLSVQGLVFQPASGACTPVLTAAFQIGVP